MVLVFVRHKSFTKMRMNLWVNCTISELGYVMQNFVSYLRSIVPMPIEIMILDGYRYAIKAPSSLVYEDNRRTEKRLLKNKRIKSFNGWHLCKDLYYKFAIVEFVKNVA